MGVMIIAKKDSDFLMHHGVKGQKWGVRKKDYRPTSVRAAIAQRQNAKVDKSFKKWKTGSNNRDNAIELGKKANASKIAFEKDKSKENKSQYKSDNNEYKKALRQNTSYRKGTVRQEVGKDLARQYMTEAKRAKKSGDMKTYSSFMNKHDIERARARKAQAVGQRRSQYKASLKRSATISMKAAATSAAIGIGLKYVKSKGLNISSDQINAASSYVKKGATILSYMY